MLAAGEGEQAAGWREQLARFAADLRDQAYAKGDTLRRLQG
jgi:5-(carboxyamino)imidazole ribonucleotide mutase